MHPLGIASNRKAAGLARYLNGFSALMLLSGISACDKQGEENSKLDKPIQISYRIPTWFQTVYKSEIFDGIY